MPKVVHSIFLVTGYAIKDLEIIGIDYEGGKV